MSLNSHTDISRVALASPILGHIGEVDAVPRLARAITRSGYGVDLLQAWNEWESVDRSSLPEGMRVVDLRLKRYLPVMPSIRWASSWAHYRMWSALTAAALVPAIRRYLRSERPNVMVARMLTAPLLMSALASGTSTPVVLSMGGLPRSSPIRSVLWKRFYPKATGFVAPAESVATAAATISGIPADQFEVIPNPVIDDLVVEKGAAEAPDHPWFGVEGQPLILAVGRMTRQKDFGTLIRSLKRVREKVPARLMILGEGEHRSQLEALVSELGLTESVTMPGFDPNPYRHMKAADVFVMPSLWEGPGHVLIEAQAMGVPVVSTDCPAGPRETLLDGEAGELVPVGGSTEMADAILRVLDSPETTAKKIQLGLDSSGRFYDQNVGAKWRDYLDRLLVAGS